MAFVMIKGVCHKSLCRRTSAMIRLAIFCFFLVCVLYALDSKRACRSIVFVVLSGANWNTIGIQGAMTWHKHIKPPHRLVVATNVPTVLAEGKVYQQVGENSHKDSQRRFLDVVLRLPLKPREFLVLVDDDVFVSVHGFIRFVDSEVKSHSRMPPSVYSQLACPHICGGGGALFTPPAISLLRKNKNEQQIMLEYHDNITPWDWDVVLSKVAPKIKGLVLSNYEGNFNSQPPNFLTRFPYQDAESRSRLRSLPLTFHYVDEYHQNKYNDTYLCGTCRSLIPKLYRELYN